MPNYMTYPQAQEVFGKIDEAKQDKLIAGDGINIENNIISATGGGGGGGDMSKNTYDPQNTVADAGGIPDYVAEQSLALGETSSTAYAGNKGKANADAISAIKDGQSIDSFGDVEIALSAKISEPSSDGTSGQVLATDGSGGRYWKTVQGGSGGTSDYNDLDNKPQIGGVTLSGNKSLSDLGIAAESDIPDITGKADKVSGATNGNFAGLDSNGNLTDSGKKASDFGTYSKPSGGIPSSDMASAVQTSLGKADSAYQKPSSGIPASDIASGVIPDISGKADKVSSATNGNFAALDANGNLADSGHKHSDYLTQHQDISDRYSTGDTAETALADADYVPFYDTSASAKRKTLWSNIKSVLKTYFDTLYKGISAHDAWSDVTSKPFSTINNGSFAVSSNDLRLAGNRVYSLSRYSSDGGASTQGYRGVTANYSMPTGSTGTSSAIVDYVMKQTATASSYTFTNTPTNTNLLIDAYSSIYGESPTSVTTPTTTSVTVTFAESKSRTVAIVLK